jgi:hypothetical protein
MIKTWLVILILFMSANYLQRRVYEKYQVPSLFIFGDSLYDSENNNNHPTFAEFDYKPYGIIPRSAQLEDLPTVELQLT